MANSYYNNNLVDGDTLSESDLEEIETGFGSVETAMNLRVTKPGTPVLNHLLAMDASGEGVDSGVEASGGNVTATNVTASATVTAADVVVNESVVFDGVVDNGSSGASKTLTWGNGNKQKILLTANCTLTFTAPAGPTSLTLIITQGGSGGYTLTYPAAAKWMGGTAFQPTTTLGAISILTLIYDGTNYYGVGLPDFS